MTNLDPRAALPGEEPWELAGLTLTSRLLLGTSRYPSTQVLLDALDASGTQFVTVALRRVDPNIGEDGESLYVVNYQDGTVSKVRTADMAILQTLSTGVHPVGITYDPATRQVWVANYAGSLSVFVDR